MQVGHKIAYSKGGSTTLRNSVCLCYKCNKLQGTDSWSMFLRKLGKPSSLNDVKSLLRSLIVPQLKKLAKKYNITVKGKKVEEFFTDTIKPPTKAQYVSTLSKKISTQEINSFKRNVPKTTKYKKK